MPKPRRDSNGQFPAYTWTGGYPVFYLCADNGILCAECANRKNGSLATDTPSNCPDDKQWTLTYCEINWEDHHMQCDHCNAPINCAYPSDKDEDEDDTKPV